jgi:hypothetical protein
MSQPDFNQVCNQFRQFRAILGQALAAPGDAAVKQQLQSVTATLDRNFAELQTAYPNALAAIDAQLAGVHQSAEKTTAQLSGLKEAIAVAEAQAAKAVDASPPPAAVDPALGQKLREELLERFGHPVSHEGVPPSADREIWQDWNWQDWSNN